MVILVPQKGIQQHHQHQKQHRKSTQNRVKYNQHQHGELSQSWGLDGRGWLAKSDRKEKANQYCYSERKKRNQTEEGSHRDEDEKRENKPGHKHQERLDAFWAPDLQLAL